MPTQSQNMLKVVSIIMIVGAAIGILLNIVAIAGAALMVAMGVSSVLYLGIIVSVAASVVQLIAGIKGVKDYLNPQAAPGLLVLGIVMIALSVVGQVIVVAIGGSFNVWNFLLGLILPGLFIYAANNIKNGRA